MARAVAVTRQASVFIAAHLSPQAQARALAEAAKRDVAQLIAAGRASPDFTRFVDGRQGAAEETVRAGGTIAYRFAYAGEVAAFALAFLRQRAPVGQGTYRESFYLGLDGRFVPAAQFNPATMGEVAEIVIGNTQPYSRKVDVQLVGGQALQFSVPAGLFEDAATAIQRRFGRLVTARRRGTMRFPGQYRATEGARAGRLVESPAVIITFRR